jgi:hypothetical protein
MTVIPGSVTSSALAGAAKKSGPNARKATEIIRSPFLIFLFSKVLILPPGEVIYYR